MDGLTKGLEFLGGVLIIMAAIVCAVWLGLFVFFIGGIQDIVDQVNAQQAEAGPIAWGIIKILCATSVAGISFWVGVFLGGAMIADSLDK